MLILLTLEENGSQSALQIAKTLKQKTGKTVVKSAIHTTLKHLQSFGWVSGTAYRQADDHQTSHLVVAFSILSEGRDQLAWATHNVAALIDRDMAGDVLFEIEDLEREDARKYVRARTAPSSTVKHDAWTAAISATHNVR